MSVKCAPILSCKIFFFNNIHRHILSCPDLESCSPLIQQHIQTIKCRAAFFRCQLQKLRLLRIVNNIRYNQFLSENICILNEAGICIPTEVPFVRISLVSILSYSALSSDRSCSVTLQEVLAVILAVSFSRRP